MREMLLIIFLVLFNFHLYPQDCSDYKRINWMELKIDGFDLREVNKLEKTHKFEEADILYKKMIEQNKNNDFYQFLYNERKCLRTSNTNYSFLNEEECFEKIKKIILENGDLSQVLPPTIIIGLMQTDAYGLMSRNLFIKNFKIIANKTYVSNLNKAENGSYFVIYNINSLGKTVDLVIKCFKIKNSIFVKLNDRYQIYSIEECRDKNIINSLNKESIKCSFDVINFIMYGIYEFDKIYHTGKWYLSKVNNLRIRKLPYTDSEVLTHINLNDELFFLNERNAGDYINEIYDYWIKVLTKDGIIGYCFGGYLIEKK